MLKGQTSSSAQIKEKKCSIFKLQIRFNKAFISIQFPFDLLLDSVQNAWIQSPLQNKPSQSVRLQNWPKSYSVWPRSDFLRAVWTARITWKPILSNQIQATFICGFKSDTHLDQRRNGRESQTKPNTMVKSSSCHPEISGWNLFPVQIPPPVALTLPPHTPVHWSSSCRSTKSHYCNTHSPSLHSSSPHHYLLQHLSASTARKT